MTEVYDCTDSAELLKGMRVARQAVAKGELIVIPTDTVYGVAADAFTPEAVQALLDAKQRGRSSPPPVLIPNISTLSALASEVHEPVQTLAETFWPGPLTIVLEANSALSWDLGDTGGTVALRIPDHTLTLELLEETGPLAVSSANTSGEPAATTAGDAQRMLGDTVAVYLEQGVSSETGKASTIIDATKLSAEGGVLRLLREGQISRDAIQEALPNVVIEG